MLSDMVTLLITWISSTMALGEETWRREASWEATFNELKLYHDKAYKKIDEALKFDEEGQKNKALAAYDEGLMLIDKALAVNIECPSNPDFSWEKACSMVDKLRKTRKEILSRIADTQVQRPAELRPPERPEDLALEPPPSYEEAMATSPVNRSPAPVSSPRTYTELGQALQELKVEADMQSVQVIFHVEDVRVYFISPDGTVSAPSQPNQLRILQLEDGRDASLPKFFLQVGDWFYPLVPDVSPCFRSDYGAFILPDLRSDVEGAAVGLILPPESDISLYNFLEDVLHGVVSQPPAVPPRIRGRRDNFSTSISKGIVSGAHYLSTGLIKGAEAASQYMTATTPKIISRIQPEEPRPVPPTLRTGAKVARSVTHTAVNVTGYVESPEKPVKHSRRHKHSLSKLTREFNKKLALRAETPSSVEGEEMPGERPRGRRRHGRHRQHATFVLGKSGKVGSATMALGRYLAPHIQRGGTALLSKAGVGEQTAAEGVGGVLTVAAGAVEGFGTIYTGLEQSAGILGTSLTNNTVQIVQHKYGEPMAEVTGDTLYTVGNVINTSNNIHNLTPKGLAKRAAKNTGKAIVEPHLPDKGLDEPSTSYKQK
ncbi:protein spartin isoform X2 [Homalodisca vitripennis]|uniref:protein spartin isoform X2 n=1 Tax=Homalodisca vitripennis TaxID=197043 RepID=UPI001EE9BB7E|nr:protein spartin isoform X2 [Homalodisca vitripennis]